MNSKKDYYEILGVKKNDSKEKIKKAYKKLAMKYHPDRVSENEKEENEKKFKEINEAYTILGDEKKRQQYDTYGQEAFEQGNFSSNPFNESDFSSILKEMFGNSFFGGGRRNNPFSRKIGEDLQYELTLTFEEAVFGCTKKIKIRKNVSCDSCEGTGSSGGELNTCKKCNGEGIIIIQRRTPMGILQQETICDKCHGEGKVPNKICHKCLGKGILRKEKSIEVNIPRGIDSEQMLKIRGEGNAIKNGQNGDLILIINVIPSKIFRREGDDIYLDISISFSQAALGCKISVPTLDGNKKIKISPGIESGEVLRIKGEGIENVEGYRKGNLYVTIKIKTPKRLNRKQKALFEKLSKLE